MIYHLFEYLREIGYDLPGQGLLQYLSFRAIASFTTALLISIFAGEVYVGIFMIVCQVIMSVLLLVECRKLDRAQKENVEL